jgi:ADP-ribose pyrophosphatase YjhB (NUDIX family)
MHTTQRVAAYAVCRVDDRILLARFVTPDGTDRYWTLPGGGVDHGEDPYDAVVREVAEETGYAARVDRLLGVDTRTVPYRRSRGELHNIGVFYRATVIGGELRSEVGGSTDLAAWLSEAEVPELPRAQVVDVGLALDRDVPPTGHVPRVDVGGLLRR